MSIAFFLYPPRREKFSPRRVPFYLICSRYHDRDNTVSGLYPSELVVKDPAGKGKRSRKKLLWSLLQAFAPSIGPLG